MGLRPGGPGNEPEGREQGDAMMLGLNAADCLAAGARHQDLRREADRNRAARDHDADAPGRSRGVGAARHGIGAVMARFGARPQGVPQAGSTTAAPPAALGTAR